MELQVIAVYCNKQHRDYCCKGDSMELLVYSVTTEEKISINFVNTPHIHSLGF